MTTRTIRLLTLFVAALVALLDAGAVIAQGNSGAVGTYVVVLRPGAGPDPDPVRDFHATYKDGWGTRRVYEMALADAALLRQNPRVRYVQWLPDAGGAPSQRSGVAAVRLAAPSAVLAPWSTGTYRYDGSGNITGLDEDGEGVSRQYVYDDLSRLAQVYRSNSAEPEYAYTYDGFGNRLSRTDHGFTMRTEADPHTNRLLSAGTDPAQTASNWVQYDSAGNITQFNLVAGFAYDAFNAVTAISPYADQSAVRYALYTADDERLALCEPRAGTCNWTVRALDQKVVREYESPMIGGGTAPRYWLWVEDYVYRGDQLLAAQREEREGGRMFFHLDHLGSPRIVTNDYGQVAANDYEPFGLSATDFSAETQKEGFERAERMRFTGHQRDFLGGDLADNKLYVDYMHARSYDPAFGRFLSVDPIPGGPQHPLSWNRYAYALNNPQKYYDPTGTEETGYRCDENGDHCYYETTQAAQASSARAFADKIGSLLDRAGCAVFVASGTGDIFSGILSDDFRLILRGLGKEAMWAGPGAVTSGMRALRAAGVIAADSKAVMVIGKLADTEVLANTAGHEVLNLVEWTLAKNDAWIMEGVSEGRNFYLASEVTAANLTNPTYGLSVFGRELGILMKAGYTRVGNYLIAP